MLEEVYAALRPQYLRTRTGTTAFTRGADIRLIYELANTSATTVEVPLTDWYGRSSYFVGVEQTWIEPLGPDAAISACLPNAGRKGAWYAAGGRIVQVLGPPGNIFPPGRGSSSWLSLPAGVTACLPAGAYRYHLEYKPLDADGLDDVIAEVTIDLELRNGALAATIADGGIAGTATLTLAADGTSGQSIVSLGALGPGETVSSTIRATACGSEGPLIAAPPAFTTTLGGTYRQRWFFTVHAPDARTAIMAGAPLSIRASVGRATVCATYVPAPDEQAAVISPTALPGALLEEDLGGGRVVRASSEIVAGPPSGAFDGLRDVTWNSGGFPPAWIEIDFGEDRTVAAIRLLPAQLPTVAETVHRVYGRADGETAEVLLFEFAGVTEDNRWMATSLKIPQRARYVRVETVLSPSWVAWREIDILTAD